MTADFLKVFYKKKKNQHILCVSNKRLLTALTSTLRRKEQKAINQRLTFNGNLCQNVVWGNSTYATHTHEVETLVYTFKKKNHIKILIEK